MMSPEEWAEKFGDELRTDAGDWCWNKQHEEKLALYFRQAIEETLANNPTAQAPRD